MPREGLARFDEWLTTEPPDFELSAPDGEADDKERDWAYLEGEARDFARKYGVAAMIRCISNATE